MKTEFIAIKGKVYSKSFKLLSGQKLIVGRGQDVDIQILDAGLSREHCMPEKIDDEFHITDLQSRNDTYVNRECITRQKLADGDLISVGGIEFRLRCAPDHRQMQADLIAR